MSYRLLHSLVFSSVVVLEGSGCAESHAPPMSDPDASVMSSDAGPVVPPDSGPDLRLCEGGWPPTKGTTCAAVEGMELFLCCPVGADDLEACCHAAPPTADETP